MADLEALEERIADLDAENRGLAAEVRRLRCVLKVADRWAAEGQYLKDLSQAEGTAASLRKILYWRSGCRLDLGHRLARCRRWVASQGQDGPHASYPIDPRTLRRGPARQPVTMDWST